MSQIILYVIAFNVALAGVKKGLDVIKDHTADKWDNDLSDRIGAWCDFIKMVLDTIGFNPEHADVPAGKKPFGDDDLTRTEKSQP